VKYRKKPVVIEAVQLRWDTWSEMCDHVGMTPDGLQHGRPEGCYIGPDGQPLPAGQTSMEMGLLIPTLEGLMVAREKDWIIRGVKGELYPCKPDIFEATYEATDSESAADKELTLLRAVGDSLSDILAITNKYDQPHKAVGWNAALSRGRDALAAWRKGK